MTAIDTTFETFRDRMLAEGYDEVIERRWEPGQIVPTHSHPFEANALFVQGEMWLTEQDGPTRRLVPGDRFHLQANVPHDERYGPEGGTYWVARRNG
ncbi:cupin domain-containing protein [Piscinibacter sakaiensis]|uniref:cupin domain-containing protein n=1 Tax=Piscinibacter sakaiensis TaxID=1547922 RepID=UPI003AAF6140